MLLHALFAYHAKFAVRFFLITFFYALVVEQIGVRTGGHLEVMNTPGRLAIKFLESH